MENTKISWCDHTFNAWQGCIKVNECCKHCYAETLDKRWGGNHWGPNTERKVFNDKYWNQPIKWNHEASLAGERQRVFCSSLADVFEFHSGVVASRERLFKLIKDTPMLIWMVLTKRPQNILKMIPLEWHSNFPENVRFGVSVGMQEHFDTMVPVMESTCWDLGAAYFLSMEPLLGPVNMEPLFNSSIKKFSGGERPMLWPSYIIVGGESGHGARPMHPDWAMDIGLQCDMFGIKFHFKQQGQWMLGHFASNMDNNILLDLEGNIYKTIGDAMEKNAGYSLCKLSLAKSKDDAGHKLYGKTYDALID